jgi:predicted DNA-binding transcriptional regulator AlpA
MMLKREYFSVEEVAEHFGVSVSTVLRAARDGAPSLPGFPRPVMDNGKGTPMKWHISQIKGYDNHLLKSAA